MSSPLSGSGPAFLASVTSVEEAFTAFAAGADVIDCKDPSAGALGRLDLTEIARIVSGVSALAPVSATIGDTFTSVGEAVRAAKDVAATGVAIVKCGYFGASQDGELAVALGSADLGKAHLFAVLMADRAADLSLVPHLAQAGFIGVMLDTADKRRGSLRALLSEDRIVAFLSIARLHGLATGLAGSLTRLDIAPLAALSPDILGFRSALCADGRQGSIDERRVADVRGELDLSHASQRKRSFA